jgi:hypothetical protein
MSTLSDIDFAVFLYKRNEESYFGIKCSLYVDFCEVLKRNEVDMLELNTTTKIVLLEEIISNGLVV